MIFIADRKKDQRLQELFNQGKHVYSFSKLSTIENCPYEAYLTYKQHRKGNGSVYGILGTCIHDKLEEIINGDADTEVLESTLNEELEQLELLDLHFPKDFKGGDSIRDGWIDDMTHFVNNFEIPEGEFKTEELLIYKIDEDHYIQGYADLVRYDKDGQSILDWKTSSIYTGDDLLHHGRQLVIYALAKEQQGIKINELAWIFLKYVEVSFMGKKRSNSKNKSEITKIINRRKIAEILERYIRDDLEELGCDEITIESLIYQVNKNNSLDCLPNEIKENYNFKPCIVKYALTDDIRNETIDYIDRTIKSFEERGDNESDWEPRNFTKITKSGKEVEDTFFCNFLCNHRKTCRHIIEHQSQINDTDNVLEGLL